MVHYKPLKHRLEFVSTIDGRRLYNDSKATNPDATINALHAFDEKPSSSYVEKIKSLI